MKKSFNTPRLNLLLALLLAGGGAHAQTAPQQPATPPAPQTAPVARAAAVAPAAIQAGLYVSREAAHTGGHFELHCKSVTAQAAACDMRATDGQGTVSPPLPFSFVPMRADAQDDLRQTAHDVLLGRTQPMIALQSLADLRPYQQMFGYLLGEPPRTPASPPEDPAALGPCWGDRMMNPDCAICPATHQGQPAVLLFLRGWFTATPFRTVLLLGGNGRENPPD